MNGVVFTGPRAASAVSEKSNVARSPSMVTRTRTGIGSSPAASSSSQSSPT